MVIQMTEFKYVVAVDRIFKVKAESEEEAIEIAKERINDIDINIEDLSVIEVFWMKSNNILKSHFKRIKKLVRNFERVKDDRDLATIRKNIENIRWI